MVIKVPYWNFDQMCSVGNKDSYTFRCLKFNVMPILHYDSLVPSTKKIHYAKILSTEPYNLFVYIDVAFPAFILEGFKFDKNVEISPKKA